MLSMLYFPLVTFANGYSYQQNYNQQFVMAAPQQQAPQQQRQSQLNSRTQQPSQHPQQLRSQTQQSRQYQTKAPSQEAHNPMDIYVTPQKSARAQNRPSNFSYRKSQQHAQYPNQNRFQYQNQNQNQYKNQNNIQQQNPWQSHPSHIQQWQQQKFQQKPQTNSSSQTGKPLFQKRPYHQPNYQQPTVMQNNQNNQTTQINSSQQEQTWLKHCMGSASNKKATSVAKAFCECGWQEMQTQRFPLQLLTSKAPGDIQKVNRLFKVISQICLVRVMPTQNGKK